MNYQLWNELGQISSKSRRILLVSSYIAIPLLIIIDYYLGPEVSSSILYVIPIVLITVLSGQRAGLLISVISTAGWLIADLQPEHVYSYWLIPYWNAGVHLGLFIIIVYLLSIINTSKQELENKVDERTKSLRENERRLREAQTLGKIGDWELDPHTGTLTLSDEMSKLIESTSISDAPLDLSRILVYLHPEDASTLQASIQRAIETGESWDHDTRATLPSGRHVWYHTVGVALRDDKGKVNKLYGATQDITERKQAEEAIRNNNRMLLAIQKVMLEIGVELRLPVLLSNILEQAELMLHADRGGGIYLYDAREDVLQLAYGSGINQGRDGIVIPKGKGVAGCVYDTSQPLIINDYTHWAGHATVLMEDPPSAVMGVPLFLNDKVIGVLTMIANSAIRTFTDDDVKQAEMFGAQAAIAIQNARLYQQAQQEILDRKHAEQTLRESQDSLDAIVNSTPDMIWAVDSESFQVMWWNRSFEVYMLQQRQVQVKAGMGPKDFFPDLYYVQSWERFYKKVLEYGPYTTEYQATPGTRIFQLSFNVLKRDGRVYAISNFGRDITERKQAEEELRALNDQLETRVIARTMELHQTNAELEHANHAKDEFLANMSHELRTPLSSILGLSESLLEQKRGMLNESQRRSLQTIESSGQHLLELINDILDLSKIEAGKFDCYPEIISIEDVCNTSLALIKNQAARKSIQVTYRKKTGIFHVSADPRRLKQVLVNLLTNAIKFTPQGGHVALEVDANQEQELIQFSVTDDGIGIAQKDLQRLFKPFVQVESQLNRSYDGTGLGLTLVQKLIDMHGGSVHVESEVGKGSRFTVNLPWVKEMFAELPGESGTSLLRTTETAGEPASVPETQKQDVILLAEDNSTNILMIGEYLESHGYYVVVAHDGMEVLEKANTIQPDIILMDIQMPVLDGLEATRRLRANPRFATTPIIALTALAMPGDRERCLSAGANEYMSKPVSLKELVKTIATFLKEEKK